MPLRQVKAKKTRRILISKVGTIELAIGSEDSREAAARKREIYPLTLYTA